MTSIGAPRTVVLALGLVAVTAGIAAAADCMERFPVGRFGVSPGHPAATAPALAAFTPLYLVRQPLPADTDDCTYVYTADVFRMRDTPGAGARLAGCVGDFDGDGRPDLALLMKRRRDGVVVAVVVRGAGGPATELDGITDPYGFAEDATIWPGPFCRPRPPSGRFRSDATGKSADVVGDLFTVGWKTYFWNPRAGRFDAILTSD